MPGVTRSFTKTFTNNSQFKLILDWSYSQHTGNNTSTVTAILKVQSMGYGNTSGWQSKSAGISINGNNMGFTVNPNMGANQTKELARRSYTFSHNGDGTKSVNISANVNYTGIRWNGGNLGNVTVGGNATLKTIPRASSIGTITGSQIGSGMTIPINRASATFTHDVSLTLGGQTVSATGVATSATLTPNLANFCSQLPNSTSGTATVKVVTKSGGTVIGTTTKSHVIYVPDSVKPSFTSLVFLEAAPDVKALNLGTNRFVRGKSTISATLKGSGIYGSSIKTHNIHLVDFGVVNSSNASFGLYKNWNISGNATVKWSMEDSRGRWVSGSSTISVLHYELPRIIGFSVNRTTDGSVSIKKVVSAMRIDTNKTDFIIRVEVLENGIWVSKHSQTNQSTESITLSGFSVNRSYQVRLYVADYFGSISSSTVVSTSKVLMDLNKDVGVGVGKKHERGVLDIGGMVSMNRNYIKDGGVLADTRTGNSSTGAYWAQYPPGVSVVYIGSRSGVTSKPFTDGFYLVSNDGYTFSVMAQGVSPIGIKYMVGNKNYPTVSWRTVL